MDEEVRARVTPAERRRAETAARIAGITLSELVRQATRQAAQYVLSGNAHDG
jgi:uncharacterized protein (DUF1778 family)